jgi:hypothetical protein
METTVPVNQTVNSPNLKSVNLKQNPGKIVTEGEVLLQGPVKGARVNWVTP